VIHAGQIVLPGIVPDALHVRDVHGDDAGGGSDAAEGVAGAERDGDDDFPDVAGDGNLTGRIRDRSVESFRAANDELRRRENHAAFKA
jgi:hypothetical protein